MLPLPGQEVPLALINATIDKKVNEYMTRQENAVVLPTVLGEVAADPTVIAKGLLVQADLLEKDAAAKREEAYALDPESRPGRGRPPLPEDAKAIAAAERKIKRRERDRANAILNKAAKIESAIDTKVAAKLKRDAVKPVL
jgi:hypothetical protein